MTRSSHRAIAFSLLMGACAASPVERPPQQPVVIAEAPAVAPAPDPMSISVVAARASAQLAVDGDLSEWGSLVPPPRTPGEPEVPPPEPPRLSKGNAPAKATPGGRNPPDAASHVAVALTGDALLIAGELGEPAREGIWLSIGTRPPELPPIGHYTRGGYVIPLNCEFKQVYKGEGGWENGPRNPPEVEAACKGLLERHAQMVVAYEKRFARVLEIDREGVHRVEADGSLAAIEGAKAAWRQGAKGATFEIALPLAALPRMVEAPVDWLRVAARAVASGKPPAPAADAWVWLHLPAAVSFEPWGELRARAFDAVGARAFFPGGRTP